MLRQVLDAHGGQPDDLVVSFQNTSAEHPKTYEFVERVAQEWGVEIVWLEMILGEHGTGHRRAEDVMVVTPETARKDCEVFEDLIRNRQFLPNPVMRFCTESMKVKALSQYLDTLPAFCEPQAEVYTHAIGLRGDEPHRVHRVTGLREKLRQEVVCPLYDAGVDKEEILRWWEGQPFDLELPHPAAGNCVLCPLKSRHQTEELMAVMPEFADWWIRMEEEVVPTGRFRKDRPSYAAMKKLLDEQGWLFDPNGPDDETIPCMCTD
jgi:3'-phosphoadenosine 5'-phosphosulfate sulfotransferase (PAPS reductase)/FAD synthetase